MSRAFPGASVVSNDKVNCRLVRAQAASGVRDEQCKRFDTATWSAVCWLREHRDRFRGKVYEPARLNVFIKKEWNGRRIDNDQDLINMIEGPIPMGSFSVCYSRSLSAASNLYH